MKAARYAQYGENVISVVHRMFSVHFVSFIVIDLLYDIIAEKIPQNDIWEEMHGE